MGRASLGGVDENVLELSVIMTSQLCENNIGHGIVWCGSVN